MEATDGMSPQSERMTQSSETPEQTFERHMATDPRAAFYQAGSVLGEFNHPGQVRPAEWEQREDRAWESFAQQMIVAPIPKGEGGPGEYTHEQLLFLADMQALYGRARFMPEGYKSGHPG